eukprot:CAMPEP_0201719804 /NCGR_PEP_ID=MMETSP0593-20130828/4921_1 /ASSEMBLY_ACC=CAM_ASM_000672 /TAXON_ID=267983 /ORGANISM="Skeletonema japonicum, Strain CCMP2506" /LENGTH=567 /DNA_ID=CAMNT_0048210323 /DNA_START=62 /DNA_END=1765 /DNA_ORIENTATION=+
MAQTRNTPIKSSDPAMTTKPTSSSPPPAATALNLEDNDDIAKDSAAPSSPPSKRRKIDEELEEHPKKIPAANTNNSSALVKSNEDSQSNSSTAAAASINTASAISTASGSSAANMDTIDVANMLGLKPGDRIEVKWNINEDDEDEDDQLPPPPIAAEGERLGLPKTEGEEDEELDGSVGDAVETTVPLKSNQDDTATNDNDKMNIGENEGNNNNTNSNSSSPAPPGMISVWWKATVQKATGEYHILDDTNEAMDSPIKTLQQPPPPPPTVAAAVAASITTSTDKNQTYNCPKCAKQNMSKQGLYTHYGMVHGGKISRDYPNLLSQQQQQQQQQDQHSNNSNTSNTTSASLPKVRIPIYEIIYDPLPSLGFPEYSHEEVAFISNVTLLNLSSEEMMNFRREGELCSPLVEDGIGVGGREVVSGAEGGALRNDVDVGGGGGGLTDLFGKEAAAATTTTTTTASKPPPPPQAAAAQSTNPNDIYKEFRTQDDIRSYMNELMQKSLLSTGMNARMASLPRSQQNVIAGRINDALEGLLGKMMEEMGRVPEGGNRVVTADVVRRCMEQMHPV